MNLMATILVVILLRPRDEFLQELVSSGSLVVVAIAALGAFSLLSVMQAGLRARIEQISRYIGRAKPAKHR